MIWIPAVVLAFLLAAAAPTSGAELVPSVGLTRATDGDQAKSNLGLALRGTLVPRLLDSEIGVSYRRDEYYDGALAVKQWPVTASLLVRPLPTLHGDAGVGWYHTSYDYKDPLLADETKQQFGVHVGGGVEIPVAPRAALDLTGRYVFLRDQESRIVPERFNPDFWTLSLGLALRL
ncbi:MAG: outer membrane protein [Hyphomicrobiales bacterium]